MPRIPIPSSRSSAPVPARTAQNVSGTESNTCNSVRPFVAHRRVSTGRQGESGLQLEAQREALSRFFGSTSLLAQFTDIESGQGHTNLAEGRDPSEEMSGEDEAKEPP